MLVIIGCRVSFTFCWSFLNVASLAIQPSDHMTVFGIRILRRHLHHQFFVFISAGWSSLIQLYLQQIHIYAHKHVTELTVWRRGFFRSWVRHQCVKMYLNNQQQIGSNRSDFWMNISGFAQRLVALREEQIFAENVFFFSSPNNENSFTVTQRTTSTAALWTLPQKHMKQKNVANDECAALLRTSILPACCCSSALLIAVATVTDLSACGRWEVKMCWWRQKDKIAARTTERQGFNNR